MLTEDEVRFHFFNVRNFIPENTLETDEGKTRRARNAGNIILIYLIPRPGPTVITLSHQAK